MTTTSLSSDGSCIYYSYYVECMVHVAQNTSINRLMTRGKIKLSQVFVIASTSAVNDAAIMKENSPRKPLYPTQTSLKAIMATMLPAKPSSVLPEGPDLPDLKVSLVLPRKVPIMAAAVSPTPTEISPHDKANLEADSGLLGNSHSGNMVPTSK